MMSLYKDNEPNGPWLSLGGTFDVYRYFGEVANVVQNADPENSGEKYKYLWGVIPTAEDQEATSKEWRANVQQQASDVLRLYSEQLSGDAKRLLGKLKKMRFTQHG